MALWHNHRAVNKETITASLSVGAPVPMSQLCYGKVAPPGLSFPMNTLNATLRPWACQAVLTGGCHGNQGA
ncbi:hypothetical protein KSZ_53440 [Dictyobacter formicarum]|uniref:Uncharacterized protein n=1 Tax=Dictyobacter formicarum TaxID=2778368 RepID=A0ABQ3VP28_9CHLR|nr:hypothetical protein KSZ_53440 [Dictyobacter formicarum]